jgi:hypothetical protein
MVSSRIFKEAETLKYAYKVRLWKNLLIDDNMRFCLIFPVIRFLGPV